MPKAQIWTGLKVVRLSQFLAKLRSADKLIGRNDELANRMLEDALEELQGVLGERAGLLARRRRRPRLRAMHWRR